MSPRELEGQHADIVNSTLAYLARMGGRVAVDKCYTLASSRELRKALRQRAYGPDGAQIKQ
eukprot:15400220-Alexandrium_andersonii.AAC.1